MSSYKPTCLRVEETGYVFLYNVRFLVFLNTYTHTRALTSSSSSKAPPAALLASSSATSGFAPPPPDARCVARFEGGSLPLASSDSGLRARFPAPPPDDAVFCGDLAGDEWRPSADGGSATRDLVCDVCCCFRPYEDKKNWFSQAENFRELDEGSGPKTTASSTTKPVCLAFRQLPRGLHVVHLSMAITSRLCLHPTCCPTLPLHPLPPAPFDDSPWRLSSLSHQSSLRSSPLILSCHLVDPWGVLPPAPPSLLTASRMLHTLTSLLMVS